MLIIFAPAGRSAPPFFLSFFSPSVLLEEFIGYTLAFRGNLELLPYYRGAILLQRGSLVATLLGGGAALMQFLRVNNWGGLAGGERRRKEGCYVFLPPGGQIINVRSGFLGKKVHAWVS